MSKQFPNGCNVGKPSCVVRAIDNHILINKRSQPSNHMTMLTNKYKVVRTDHFSYRGLRINIVAVDDLTNCCSLTHDRLFSMNKDLKNGKDCCIVYNIHKYYKKLM